MTVSKNSLIMRKELVKRQIMQTQREIEKQHLFGSRASKQIAVLERKLQTLQSEEATLRQEIDKAPAES